jgi:hypothetical protein
MSKADPGESLKLAIDLLPHFIGPQECGIEKLQRTFDAQIQVHDAPDPTYATAADELGERVPPKEYASRIVIEGKINAHGAKTPFAELPQARPGRSERVRVRPLPIQVSHSLDRTHQNITLPRDWANLGRH